MNATSPQDSSHPKVDKVHRSIKAVIESILFRMIGVERNAKISAKQGKKKK